MNTASKNCCSIDVGKTKKRSSKSTDVTTRKKRGVSIGKTELQTTTLTQLFDAHSNSSPPELTEDTSYLRPRNTAELYYHAGEHYHAGHYYYTSKYVYWITRFEYNTRGKASGVCPKVYLRLEDTILGEKFSKVLRHDQGWMVRNPDGLVQVANTSTILQKGRVNLSDLFKDKNFHSLPKLEGTPLLYEESLVRNEHFKVVFRQQPESAKTMSTMKPTNRKSNDFSEGQNKPRVMDVFAGCGGLSEGFVQAQCRVTHAIERNQEAAASFKMNHPYATVYDEDFDHVLACMQSRDEAYPKRGDFDIITFGSPCQGFSRANRNGGKNDKMNNQLLLDCLKMVELCQPGFTCLEQVPSVTDDVHMDYFRGVLVRHLKFGYQIRVFRSLASNFGVPQNRERLFFVGAKLGKPLPKPPIPSHGEGTGQPIKTVADALGILENVEPSSGGAGFVKVGSIVAKHHREQTRDLRLKGRNEDDETLVADEPSRNTLMCRNGLIHYKFNRYVTLLERALLQSFPISYKFYGNQSQVSDQIGNAVPPGLAKPIAMSIVKAFKGSCD